jgi:hypothetical protein
MLNHALHGFAAFEQIVLSAMPADCQSATQGPLAICCGTIKLNLDFVGPSCDIPVEDHFMHNSSESEDIRNQGSLCKELQPSFHYRLIAELHR